MNRSNQSQPVTGFEIEDKPTPLAGKILLIIMTILLLFLGWQGLDDVYDIPNQPEFLSSCIRPYISSINPKISSRPHSRLRSQQPPDSFGRYPNSYASKCTFSKIEVKYQIPTAYQSLKTAKKSYNDLQSQVTSKQRELNTVTSDLRDKEHQYDLLLQEKIAQETNNPNYNANTLKLDIQALEQQKSALKQTITVLKKQADQEEIKFKPQEETLRQTVKKFSKEYNRSWAIYQFWVFLIQLAFVLPTFLIILKLYFKEKAKDSPYTLIFTTLVGAVGILLAKVTITYFWALFLANLIQVIWSFIKNTALLRTLIYYLGMLVVVSIFGGAVYSLQKKVFNPKRVERRRLKKSLCPYCEFPLQFAKTHCPGCGHQIKKECSNCGQLRFKVMDYCPHCGR